MKHPALFVKTLMLLAAAAALSLGSPLAQASSDYFLQIDGIEGDATAKGYKDWINMESFSWGVSAASSGDGGLPVFNDFAWTQFIDGSTPGLFDALTSGKHIPKAIAEITTVFGGGALKPYFRMTFEDVSITSIDIGGAGGSVPMLAGAFAYNRILFDFWTMDSSGKLVRHDSASYDLKKGGSLGALGMLYARGMAGPEITAAVPEPETWALLLAGLGLMGAIVRRRSLAGQR